MEKSIVIFGIKIKTITIVQIDNKDLKEELKEDTKIRKYTTKDLENSFSIQPESIVKIKKEIEKKEYYVQKL